MVLTLTGPAPARTAARTPAVRRDPRPAVDRPTTRRPQPPRHDIVDEWGHGSFPASDPPSNW